MIVSLFHYTVSYGATAAVNKCSEFSSWTARIQDLVRELREESVCVLLFSSNNSWGKSSPFSHDRAAQLTSLAFRLISAYLVLQSESPVLARKSGESVVV